MAACTPNPVTRVSMTCHIRKRRGGDDVVTTRLGVGRVWRVQRGVAGCGGLGRMWVGDVDEGTGRDWAGVCVCGRGGFEGGGLVGAMVDDETYMRGGGMAAACAWCGAGKQAEVS